MKQIKETHPLLLTDFYKVGHIFQEPEHTRYVYGNMTPRKSRIKGVNKVVTVGIQRVIKKWLINYFNDHFFNIPKEEAVNEYKRVVKNTIGPLKSYKHIEELHDLGYLPLKIKAIPEGELIPLRVPFFTIVNTHPRFAWLTCYMETLISAELWQIGTSATIAHEFRKVLDKYAALTGVSPDFVQWQGHDFSFRGMSSVETAKMSGAGHLLSFTGTDTIPAITDLENYYNADVAKELVGGSVQACEHSITSSNIGRNMISPRYPEYEADFCTRLNKRVPESNDRFKQLVGEFAMFKRLITEVCPSKIISIVSDTFNLWDVLTLVMPALKPDVLARDGKVVIRPDSGDPCDILCGTVKHHYIDLETAKDAFEDDLRNNQVHGQCDITIDSTRVVTVNGKYYMLMSDIDWSRHDKQYYYIDKIEIATTEEITPSPAHKGVIELLWDVFGGTMTNTGFKMLDSHVGAIYGDSITIDRAIEISERLMAKRFATQVVYGIGSYTYQYVTRDTFGTAMKGTHTIIEDVSIPIYKNPITDDGTKVSARGYLRVDKVNGEFCLKDNCTIEESEGGELRDVFEDSKLLVDDCLNDLRDRLAAHRK